MLFYKATRLRSPRKHVSDTMVQILLHNASLLFQTKLVLWNASTHVHALLGQQDRLWKLTSSFLSETLQAGFHRVYRNNQSYVVNVEASGLWKPARVSVKLFLGLNSGIVDTCVEDESVSVASIIQACGCQNG